MSLKIKIIYSLYPFLSLVFTLVNFFYDDVVDYELLDNVSPSVRRYCHKKQIKVIFFL